MLSEERTTDIGAHISYTPPFPTSDSFKRPDRNDKLQKHYKRRPSPSPIASSRSTLAHAFDRAGARYAAEGSTRPAARPTTQASRHHLEPNPFEQSFSSKPSSGRSVSPDSNKTQLDGELKAGHKATRSTGGQADEDVRGDSSALHSGESSKKSSGGPSTPGSTLAKRVLPPIASMSSPSANDSSVHYPWSSSLSGSLRAGPLSPAMLAGPQNFDPTSFRTGLTPDLSSFKTGLTPLGTAGGSYPPPSPNTAAFLAMVTNASGSAITPNTLSALSGNPIDTHAANNGSLPSTQNDQDTQEGAGSGVKMTQPNYVNGAHHGSDESRAQPGAEPNRTGKQGNHGNGTNQAASGLFMLSQAHQELAKRGDGNDPYAGSAFTHGGTGLSDAKSLYSNVPSSATAGQSKSMATGSKQQRLQDAQVPQPKNGKRKNGVVVEGSKKASKKTKGAAKTEEFSPSGESDELVDESNYDMSGVNGGMHDYSNEVGADEDEKRRNFLERNRQAALKCRQRKKAWLASLQAKVEYLQTDNEHLQGSVGALRNEVMFLKSQLMQAQRQLAAHGLAPQADQMQRHSVSGPMGISTSAMMPQAMTQVPHSNIHAMAAAAAAAAANNGGMGGGVPGAPGHFQQPQHMPRPTHIPLHGGNNVNGPFGGPIGANKQQAARQGSMQAV